MANEIGTFPTVFPRAPWSRWHGRPEIPITGKWGRYLGDVRARISFPVSEIHGCVYLTNTDRGHVRPNAVLGPRHTQRCVDLTSLKHKGYMNPKIFRKHNQTLWKLFATPRLARSITRKKTTAVIIVLLSENSNYTWNPDKGANGSFTPLWHFSRPFQAASEEVRARSFSSYFGS